MRTHNKSYMLYLTEEQLQFIHDTAQEYGISGAEVCRRLLQYAMDEKKRSMDVLARYIMLQGVNRWGDWDEKLKSISTAEAERLIADKQKRPSFSELMKNAT